MKILGIDTSGKIASVSIVDENAVVASNTFLTNLTHSQVILGLVEKTLADAKISLESIDALAVSNGPGSYTGLRIGIAAVKAISFTLEKKCCGISTLESLAYNCIGTASIIIPVMKARPEVVYYSIFKSDGNNLERIRADKVASVDELIQTINLTVENIVLVGDYAKELFDEHFADDMHVRLSPLHERLQLASSLCLVAASKNEFVSPYDLEVNYLQITKAEKDLKNKTTKEY